MPMTTGLLAWMVGLAVAGPRMKVHETTVHVTAPREPTPDGVGGGSGYFWSFVGRARGPEQQSAAQVDDGRMRVSCEIRKRRLWLYLNWDEGQEWTERIPEYVECRVGRHLIRATLRQLPPLYTHPAELRFGPSVRGQLRLRSHGWTLSRRFALPAGIPFREGTVPWTPESGTARGSIQCTVERPRTRPWLQIDVRDTTEDARGACVLPVEEGAPVRVPLDIVACGAIEEVVGTNDAKCPSSAPGP